MSLNWNFQRVGGGVKLKTLCGGSMDIFWNNTILKNSNYRKTPVVS